MKNKILFVICVIMVILPMLACGEKKDDFAVRIDENSTKAKPTPVYLFVEE